MKRGRLLQGGIALFLFIVLVQVVVAITRPPNLVDKQEVAVTPTHTRVSMAATSTILTIVPSATPTLSELAKSEILAGLAYDFESSRIEDVTYTDNKLAITYVAYPSWSRTIKPISQQHGIVEAAAKVTLPYSQLEIVGFLTDADNTRRQVVHLVYNGAIVKNTDWSTNKGKTLHELAEFVDVDRFYGFDE